MSVGAPPPDMDDVPTRTEPPVARPEPMSPPGRVESRFRGRLTAAESMAATGGGEPVVSVDPAAAQRGLRAAATGATAATAPGDRDGTAGSELGSDLARIVEKYQHVDSAVYNLYRVAPVHHGSLIIDGYQGRVASRQFRCAEDLIEWVEGEYGGNQWDLVTQIANSQGKLVYAKDGRTRFSVDAPPIPKATKRNAAQFAANPAAAGTSPEMVDRAFKVYEAAAGLNNEGKPKNGEDSAVLRMLESRNTQLETKLEALQVALTKSTTEGGPTTSLLQTLLPSNNQAVLQAQQQGATALADQAKRYETSMSDADKRWAERVRDLEKKVGDLVSEHREDLADQRKELVKDKDNEVGRIDSQLKAVQLAFDTFKSSVEMTINSRVAAAEAPLKAQIVNEQARIVTLERKVDDAEKESNKLRDERYRDAMSKGDVTTQLSKAAELAGLMGLKRQDDADSHPPDRLTALLDVAEKTGAIDKIVTRFTGGGAAPAGGQAGQVYRFPVDQSGRPIVGGQSMPLSAMPPIVQPTPAPVPHHAHAPTPAPVSQPVPMPTATSAAEGQAAPVDPAVVREKMKEASDFLGQCFTNGVPSGEVAGILAMKVPPEVLANIVKGGVEQFQHDIEEVDDASPLLSGRGTSWLGNLLLAVQVQASKTKTG